MDEFWHCQMKHQFILLLEVLGLGFLKHPYSALSYSLTHSSLMGYDL